MLAGLARKIADRIAGALELPEEAAERAAYALELLLLDAITLIAIIGSALLAGVLLPALAATATSMLMRMFAGGAHSTSPWRCLIVSTVLALALGLLGKAAGPLISPSILLVLVGAIVASGLAAMIRFAPADTPAKPIPSQQAKVLKRLSLFLLLLWGAGMALLPVRRDLLVASMGGMVWQIFSVTPAGFWFSTRFDAILGKEVSENA